MDLAQSAYNLSNPRNVIVRSRLDNDFYKLLMNQVIRRRHPKAHVRIAIQNRSTRIRLAEIIDHGELREQMEEARGLRYTPKELFWIAGQSFAGMNGIFKPDFVHSLAISRLPDFQIGKPRDGQIDLESDGDWGDVMDWEMPIMEIVNGLRTRAVERPLTLSQLDLMYAKAKVKLHTKLERIRDEAPDLTLSEFGSRRRHSFPWQQYVVRSMKEVLGDQFKGTSNSYLAMEEDVEAIGTSAHEMPMVYAALAASANAGRSEEEIGDAVRASRYEVLRDLQDAYGDNLRVMLPDAFGTTSFLKDAPDWVSWWKGIRFDSKEPYAAGEEAIAWWKRHGQEPGTKLGVFADGLDVEIPGFDTIGVDMIGIHRHFRHRMTPTFGWGTTATNDFVGCAPAGVDVSPISIVCKAVEVNGRATVKISDNPGKAMSRDPAELERYKRWFGVEGVEAQAIRV